MTGISQRLRTTCVAFAMLAFTFVVAASTMAAAQSENSGKGLTGTWRVTVQLQICATGVPLGPPFSSMLSFNRGGTMSGTTTNPVFAAGQRSADLGVWEHQGRHTYTAVSEAFINFPAGMFQAGTQGISQALSVEGNTFLSKCAGAVLQHERCTSSVGMRGCARDAVRIGTCG
jgi:hypothetical protein